MKEALFYNRLKDQNLRCVLCPHNCHISESQRGICNVRINIKGRLFSEVYDRPVAIHTDPVEKKPLYHFYPGSHVVSIGTLGCNLKCSFCQNCDISQASPDDKAFGSLHPVKEILELAKEKPNNIGLAFTYNEPVVYYEYMTDLAEQVHLSGMKNIMVSNGFINREPLVRLLELIDAFNIDLKSFSPEFYKKHTKSKLEPVLETIKTIHQSGKHVELTFLVIPGLNDHMDDFNRMLDWIVSETGKSTILHISRYFPNYLMDIPPTPLKVMEGLFNLACKKLDFVYMGNVQGDLGRNTFCPGCNQLLIKRNGYVTLNAGLDAYGKCSNCGLLVVSFLDR